MMFLYENKNNLYDFYTYYIDHAVINKKTNFKYVTKITKIPELVGGKILYKFKSLFNLLASDKKVRQSKLRFIGISKIFSWNGIYVS